MKIGLWLLVVLLVLSGSALAQDALVITYGVPVEGQVGDSQTDQVWTLTVDSADRIAVTVERLSGDLLPQIALRGPDAAVLSTAGPDATGAVARIERQELPAAGNYQIVVQRLDGATGVTQGRYRLTVTVLATAVLNPANQSIVADLQYGQTLRGELTSAHWYQRYRLTASGADLIRVDVQRLSGGLQPQIEILNPSGQQIAFGWGSASADSAQTDRVELPEAGEYTIVVLRGGAIDGSTTGRYSITATLLGAGDTNPLLQRTPRDIVYGQPVTGEITARWYEGWLLSTTSADTVTIRIQSQGIAGTGPGTLIPMVAIFDAAGNELSRAWPDGTGGTAVITRFPLPAAGEYIVRAERSSGKLGGTTGPYTLTVELAGTGLDSPALTALTGSLRYGAAVLGDLTDAQWENRWQFDGRAGQAVDIVLERTSGTLFPVMELLAPDGSVVTGAWYDASRSRSIIDGAGLGQDGTYTIRVLREGQQNGATRGGYRLSLALQTP
ncbi:MAG: hypothetical protein J0M33_21825 [Anaerolineae bacterium]|nr:hypothetical protein [Anaerolineae bacterium]